MKKFIIILSILIVIALIFIAAHNLKSKPTPPATITVAKMDITATVSAVGNIMPIKTATVKSPISGTVAKLFHDEGDYVKKGDKLLEVNPQPTPADYATQKQKVATDLVQESNAKLNVKRYRYLLNQGIISQDYNDYKDAENAYKVAHLQLTLDQQLLSLMERGKAVVNGQEINNIIVSPSDGFVVERDVNVGDPVISQSDYQAGNSLFVVADMNDLVFKGQVSETDMTKLKLNMPATVTVAAFPDQATHGIITNLALQSVQLAAANNPTLASVTGPSPFNVGYKVQIGQLNWPKSMKLRAGYSATASITVAAVKQILSVPERVLQFENGNTYVWLIDNTGKTIKQNIKVGLSDGMNAQIISGLKLGDKILETPPAGANNTP